MEEGAGSGGERWVNLEGSVRRVVARIACTTVVGAS
jgi:hypothetical protein